MKLSILLITYQHQNYIQKCVDSILAQEITVEWELIIACDYSTDNTLMIAQEYLKKVNNLSIIAHEKNIGPGRNISAAIQASKGEFVAIINGDDYDVDEKKYMKQLLVFKANPDVSICFANGFRYFENAHEMVHFYDNPSEIPEKFTLSEYYEKNILGNPTTLMFRRCALPAELPDLFYNYYQTDWILISLCAQKGKIYFMNEYLSCYRIHQSSILRSTKKLRALQLAKELNNDMNKYLEYKYSAFLGNNSWYNEHLTYEYLKDKKYKNAFASLGSYLFGTPKPKPSKIYYTFATIYNILKGKAK